MGSSEGHSHGHSHSHGADPETMKLYDPKNLADQGVRITWVGFGVNFGMAVSKFFGGVYFHSQALIADAVHSVGDLVSDVLTLSTVKYSTKPPSDLYPLGYGKVETLGSLFVSGILLYAGLKIGWASLVDVLSIVLPHNVMDMITTILPAHSHTHVHVLPEASHHVHEVADAASGVISDAAEHVHEAAKEVVESPNINAAWIAAGSVAVKEWLFRATRKVGERMDSKVLIANAWHHRVDSLTSVVALVTITTGYLFNVYWLDSIGGLIVSTLVMKMRLTLL
ncbi:unnamed protein product [Ambrosiozyma monospora]|uniref:Unnamed protein product n=1 Tax=Ambrosiozyma monospora TaxID=43982 RepID=A0A9W6T1M5_AMBMO|nr:unnamed protein product [Ambrosiozyma monospora]